MNSIESYYVNKKITVFIEHCSRIHNKFSTLAPITAIQKSLYINWGRTGKTDLDPTYKKGGLVPINCSHICGFAKGNRPGYCTFKGQIKIWRRKECLSDQNHFTCPDISRIKSGTGKLLLQNHHFKYILQLIFSFTVMNSLLESFRNLD